MLFHLGLDVGSTTVKLVLMDDTGEVLHEVYRRHKSDVVETVKNILKEVYDKFGNLDITIAVTGSGGMFVEKYFGIHFVQEVIAGTKAIREYIPETDVAIELGGEDSKITYLSGNIEQRMNSICAGGTGAFIDQMASLMELDAGTLNERAKNYHKIYPIASRCGVFAKTDIQALMNQGASKEDISASVFQSVVNQTISNLACGRPIKGNIALLGGPLHFLSELRVRFEETIGQDKNTFIVPDNSQLYVALGACLASKFCEKTTFFELMKKINGEILLEIDESQTLDPLFTSQEEIDSFRDSHKDVKVQKNSIETYRGPCYLGIDAGSTTSKLVLLDDDSKILYSHYSNNNGNPLEIAIEVLKDIYDRLPEGAWIASSGITGYGEDFLRAAIGIDIGEVETIAHYTAAKYFEPDVDFILDIGGQDMKAMHITDGIIDSIQLNEACSSGCGSFIETFAKSLGMTVEDFQNAALQAERPVDLGSRCTVFMNSKVKQAQKEGASSKDIAAGLCYSVIKNALQKVIKLRDPSKLGNKVVVQGGTFYGDGILRAFEKISGKKAIRPSISGLMGAFGMALIAKKRQNETSTLFTLEQLKHFSYKQKNARCGLCPNNCALTINIFSDGSRYVTGNRCERGAGVKKQTKTLPNLYDYKYKRVFDYEPLPLELAPMGRVGLPRVLNMYENYPFWFRFFTDLGFSVVLSEDTTRKTYEKGIASITSETCCYPAKMVHGHIESLVEQGVDLIFYPSVFYEKKEYEKSQNHLNCPVVAGYPEVIKNNVDSIEEKGIEYLNPFLSFDSRKGMTKRLFEVFGKKGISKERIKTAVSSAYEELERYREDVAKEGRRALEYIEENNTKAIVLAGRPYHIDPEINHGIPGLITSLGYAVISEDSLVKNYDISQELRVLDQWVYHSRLYRAAEFVGKRKDLEMVQLNSFGCGLDAVTTDQVNEILNANGKIYTVIKIDEVSNLGAIKIRLRSLMQALEDRKFVPKEKYLLDNSHVPFTKEMKRDYTILCPQMAKDHFEILEGALKSEGYQIEFLPNVNSQVIEEGLKYVNNDACYPSIIVVGQMMDAISSGKYNVNKLALLMTQTGGACRASNYVGFIRRALKDRGLEQIPVIAISAQGIEKNPGFKISLDLLKKGLGGILLGDLLMRLRNAVKPYEKKEGETDRLNSYYIEKSKKFITNPDIIHYKKLVNEIVDAFEKIEVYDKKLIKVGIVGEILVKYLPEANNNLQDILEEEGCEVVMPDLTDFLMYCLRNSVHKGEFFSKSKMSAMYGQLGVDLIEHLRKPIRKRLKESRFHEPEYIENLEKMAKPIVSLGNQYGEGWLLTSEMIELIQQGVSSIVCIQPFGCLPNHITGKGVIKRIRKDYPNVTITPIDYDPGASEVNQINRIKLMLSSVKENCMDE